MPSKSVGGFDLILGKLYNDYWFNEHEPDHNGPLCTKCLKPVTVHRLQKLVLAFGNVTIKHCTVHTCPHCLHEAMIQYHKPPKQKATKKNLAAIFAKLPKSVQIALLQPKGAKPNE